MDFNLFVQVCGTLLEMKQIVRFYDQISLHPRIQ